jgi:hypothetical protein
MDTPKPEGTFARPSIPDVAQALIKAAVGTIPGLGNSLAALIDVYIPTEQQRALTELQQFIGQRLDGLEERVAAAPEEIRRQFYELYNSARLISARSAREEKLRAAARIIGEIFDPADGVTTPYDELDHLMRCIDDLSIGALLVLRRLLDLANPIGGAAAVNTSVVLMSSLYSACKPYDDSLTLGLVTELRSKNLLYQQEAQIGSPTRSTDLLTMTPIGERLVKYLV